MQHSLQSIWQQIETLLAQNISLIPVRDKQDGQKAAKTPYGSSWKQFQSRIVDKQELWHMMEQYNTTAVAMVAGKVSGNLEIIDIDVKYNAGIDATLFADLQRFYPDLFPKLRIHRTPSGGFHILYRVWGGDVQGNQKLAGRPATETELTVNPKTRTYNFLETRGEGGYALLPPSMGYTVHQDKPIPVISWEERCAIISLCQSYNTITKVEKQPTTPRGVDNYYSENPFEHFNASFEAESVLEANGWKFFRENSQYRYYTRPDRPESGISASFSKSHRLFYIWSTSTEFNAEKWYSPSSVLSILQFNGDNKRLFQHLVSKGYGKIRQQKEKEIVKRAAIEGKPLPANLSQEALSEYQTAREIVTEQYPYGAFWVESDEGGYQISRERLYRVCDGLGFRLHNQDVVRVIDNIIHNCTPRAFFDTLKQYIKEEDADIYESIANCYESFIQKSGTFTIERLPILDTARILTSTKTVSYKFYLNVWLRIDKNGYTAHDYAELTHLVWETSIQPRNFTYTPKPENSLYHQFLTRAIGITPNLFEAIGYYAHEYKDEEGGYFCVLSEQCEDPRYGGGSGKNVFSSLFKYTTTYKNIPGSQVQFNEKFLQSWSGQRVFSISDVPKRFDFVFLKELTTGSGILKKLFRDEVALESKDMPKLIISTNYSYEVTDGGLKRRIIPIEFTDFFTRQGGVNAYFNAMFPEDWNEQDWNGFDTIIVQSITAHLAANGRLKPAPLTATGWVKQYEQMFGQLTHQFISSNIEMWLHVQEVKNEDFMNQYRAFCMENNIQNKFTLSATLMNRALEDYCEHHGIEFDKHHQLKQNNINYKCKRFTKKSDEEPFTLF